MPKEDNTGGADPGSTGAGRGNNRGSAGVGGVAGADKGQAPGGAPGVMGESDLLALATRPTSASGRIVVVDQLPGFGGIGPHPLPPEKRKIFMYINKGEENDRMNLSRHNQSLPQSKCNMTQLNSNTT